MNAIEYLKERDEWLNNLDLEMGLEQLWDCLPGLFVFMKNRNSAFVKANQLFLKRCNLAHEDEIVGKTDYDLFPTRMAEGFCRDDQEVMEQAQKKLNIVETFFNQQGLPDWFVTSKLPLFSKSGNVVGVMGIARSESSKKSSGKQHGYEPLAAAIKHIRANFRGRIEIKKLADLSGLSIRQFDRVFKNYYGLTPKKFIIKTRIQAACEALKSQNTSLANVAIDLGFYDQSSFTSQFRQHTGMTPSKYRKRSLSAIERLG